MSIETLTEEIVELKETSVKKHVLVLFDDNVNTFDHVIDTLIDVCSHEAEQAEQCAILIHYRGRTVVKSGVLTELKPMQKKISERGLTVEIE